MRQSDAVFKGYLSGAGVSNMTLAPPPPSMTQDQRDRKDRQMSDEITADTIITGAEFRDFYLNHWPAGWYVEDMPYEAESEDGTWLLPDDARHPLHWFGMAFYEGDDVTVWPRRKGATCMTSTKKSWAGNWHRRHSPSRCPKTRQRPSRLAPSARRAADLITRYLSIALRWRGCGWRTPQAMRPEVCQTREVRGVRFFPS